MVKMILTVKGKILMTVLTVVLLFAFFILFYFPAKQEQSLLKNYNDEVENFAKTVALGVKIALTEQNFEGVETAIDFVRNDPRLVSVSLIQTDSVLLEDNKTIQLEKTVFKSFPQDVEVNPNAASTDFTVVKTAPFYTPMMSGEIQLSFSKAEIIASRRQIWFTSLFASVVVFAIGFAIGYLLARNISGPVLALRDAANRVGEGDLTQSVVNNSRDEIGELSIAFNKMVKDLGMEASLERVRTKAMAMRYSKDLEGIIAALLNELDRIGLASEYSGVGIVNEQLNQVEFWTTNLPNGEKSNLKKGNIELSKLPFLTGMFSAWKNQQLYIYALKDEEYRLYYQTMKNTGVEFSSETLRESAAKELQYCFTAMFRAGMLSIFRSELLEESSYKILQRFADVFQLAYTRYLDLRKSEISAIEQLKQASLDRVRGEIASMRTAEDLAKITPVIWQELTSLGVRFIRCGIFIVDEQDQVVQSFLSTPGGQALGIFDLPYDNKLAANVVKYWRQKQDYRERWSKQEFLDFAQSLYSEGRIKNQREYLGSARVPEALFLHFFPFRQGMLYVGNTEPLIQEELQLSESLADTFSIGYARYEDFMNLKEAKTNTEKTLNELKATQSQLIQSEKMASLGELTAGIAHEIQNPLNFVNNFSEVNKELLDEMEEAIQKGDYKEAKALAKIISTNQEKINQHGKRAEGIVKGMLQHSRTSSSQKELTDINALSDEYLRLSYHGYRAKDKSFNAKFETDFDSTLPKINVVPQDIGRVVLNLINNAFYAVNEKLRQVQPDSSYEPLVAVSTKNLGDWIQITVKDNGNGIPDSIKEKIFQPFFTTKPTGQGTGLGLSLSYDIITKGHGGSIYIDSKENYGSSFIITLPQ
jgi:signal transduction histidine kinase